MKTNKNLEAKSLADLICEIAKICKEKEEYFAARFNLSPAEFKCLRLFTYEKAIPIKELTQLMNLTPGRITHILTSLENKKFVVRKHDPKDRRNITVVLKKKSQPFIEDLIENHKMLQEKLLRKIDKDKQETVVEALNSLMEAIRLWSVEN